MLHFRPESLLDGSFRDPSDRRFCHVFTGPIVAEAALPAVIGGDVLGGAVGADVLGGALGADVLGGTLGAGALTAGDISAALGESLVGPLTAGDLALGETLGGVGGALGGLGGIGGGLGDLGGLIGAGGVEGAGAGTGLTGVGGVLSTAPAAAADVAPTLATGTGITGAATASPALPVAAGDLSPTAAGTLGETATGAGGSGAGSLGPGLGTEADYAAINSAPGMGGGGDLGTAAGAVSKSGSGIDRAISSLTGGALNKSDLGTVLSGGGLLMNLMKGNQKLPGEAQLNSAAAGLSATAAGQAALGQQLEGFLQSGKLPPGVDSALRSATSAAHASIKAQHAAHGTSGSSAEASEMQEASDRAMQQGQQIALQLLQQGSSMVGAAANTEGLAASLYSQIMAEALQKDKDLGSAIGNFASSLVGTTKAA